MEFSLLFLVKESASLETLETVFYFLGYWTERVKSTLVFSHLKKGGRKEFCMLQKGKKKRAKKKYVV